MFYKSCLICGFLLTVGCAAEAPIVDRPASRTQVAVAQNEAPAATEPSQPARDQRKIIFTADLGLIVEDFSATAQRIPELVDEQGGYVAIANVNGATGSNRIGRWGVRVPTDRYREFLKAIKELGVTEKYTQSTKEVTEEYVDVESRITVKQQLEQRILKLLESHTATLEKVIEVERELGRVRVEIEQLQGKLRYLADRVAMATVTISVRQKPERVPVAAPVPPPPEPTFAARIKETWNHSVSLLRGFGESLAILGVFCAPWLAVGVPLALLGWLLLRLSGVKRRVVGGS